MIIRAMKPYSDDLRLKIVRSVWDRTSKPAAARLFGVSLSSVKRYARMAQSEELRSGTEEGRRKAIEDR
jgi:transposase